MAETRGSTKLPSYADLAQLVVSLAEMNIANIDHPGHEFISCFTFEGEFADLWINAAQYRKSLLREKLVKSGVKYAEIPRDKARKLLARQP